jgi:hypothetical protein
MEGPLIFFACMVAATLGILLTLYAVARDAKQPNHQDAPFSLYQQRDNGGLPRSDNTLG